MAAVLVAGGSGGDSRLPLASAELYDPATGNWTVTGSMHEARASHTATLLRDGTVLVAGGAADLDGQLVLASAELFDPASDRWTVTDSMSTDARGTPRRGSPMAGSWSSAAPGRSSIRRPGLPCLVRTLRPGHGALGPRRIVGRGTFWAHCNAASRWRRAHRRGESGVRQADDVDGALDPNSDRWASAAPLIDARFGHTATSLLDGASSPSAGSESTGFHAGRRGVRHQYPRVLDRHRPDDGTTSGSLSHTSRATAVSLSPAAGRRRVRWPWRRSTTLAADGVVSTAW